MIYLVRHGENRANITREFSYRKIDYPLTEKGRLQARQTACYFSDITVERIFSSPLKRAVETAAIIGDRLGLVPEVLEEFRELNPGNLEGMPPTGENWNTYFNVIARWIAGDLAFRFPGGENCNEVLARFRKGLEKTAPSSPEKNRIIVGHGGIFTVGVTILCRVPEPEKFVRIQNHNCSVSCLEPAARSGSNGYAQYELVKWADHSHLSGEAARLVDGLPEEP